MRKSIMLMLALTAVFGSGLAITLAARDDDAKPRREFGLAGAKAHLTEAKAKLAAVRRLWELEEVMAGTGQTVFRTPEERYLWSRRLLEAERALAGGQQDDEAALLRHWQQMEDVYRKVQALFSTGSKGGDTESLARAKYYRAEAELWLVEAGGAVPDDRLD